MGQRTWQSFVAREDTCGHGVQLYTDATELSDAVARYLAAGFEHGEAAVVVATPAHLAGIRDALAASGWTGDALEQGDLLFVADARETLARIMGANRPSAAAFDRVVGGLLDEAGARSIRVFGEMVDLLLLDGKPGAALELEELWNELATRRPFSLLCGYGLNVFDRDVQSETLPDVCRTHSHVLPAADGARFGRAVDEALEEALGYDQAGKVYYMVNRETRAEGIPVAQKVLMWLSKNMPAAAERVLAIARERYTARPLGLGAD